MFSSGKIPSDDLINPKTSTVHRGFATDTFGPFQGVRQDKNILNKINSHHQQLEIHLLLEKSFMYIHFQTHFLTSIISV